MLGCAVFVSSWLSLHGETVALAPFTYADPVRNDEAVNAVNADLLSLQLGAEMPYALVERAAIDRAITEQALHSQGFASPQSAARLGRLLKAEVILTGTIFTPADRAPRLRLEAVEAARAEVVAYADVELAARLQHDLFAPLSAEELGLVTRAAVPLLKQAFAVIAARPQQVLLKFLAAPNFTRSPLYKRVGERLEAELARRAAGTPTQRVLRTDRPEAATDESELRLLGLVEADASTWEQFADHYIWGSCESNNGLPVLHLSLWDGRSGQRELYLPLPEHPDAIAATIQAACDAILAASTRPTRLSPAGGFADEQHSAIAERLFEFARKLDQPAATPYQLRIAQRLVIAAIFLSPGSLKYWTALEAHRARAWRHDPVRAIAAQISFRLQLRSRFLVDAHGRIQSAALCAEGTSDFGCLRSLYAQLLGQGVSGTEFAPADAIVYRNLWERLVADVQVETTRAAEQLARAAPGQESEFRNAAESIFADIFQPRVPRWCYTPDPRRAERIVDLLTPRWKIGEALFVALGAKPTAPKVWRFDPREAIAGLLAARGRRADADRVSYLNHEELGQAVAVLGRGGATAERAGRALRAISTEGAAETVPGARPLTARQPGAPKKSADAAPSADGRVPAPGDALDFYAIASAQKVEELAAVLAKDVPAPGEAQGLTLALKEHKWLTVELFVQHGLENRAPAWGPLGIWAYTYEGAGSDDDPGAFPLAEAVAQNRLDVADQLIRAGVRFNPGSVLAEIALQRAVRRHNEPGVRRLLAAGALSLTQWTGMRAGPAGTPCLMAAVEERDLDLLKLLLAAGANVTGSLLDRSDRYATPAGVFSDAKTRMRNAIFYAAAEGWRDGVEAMLIAPTFSAGAIYRKDLPLAEWPYQLATDPVLRGRLLRASLQVMSPRPAPGERAGIDLFSAIASNDAPRVAAAWAVPEARTLRLAGQPALVFAIRERRPTLARWLVQQGAAVDETDSDGVPPVLYATERGDLDLVRLLVAKKANVNAGCGRYGSPLLHAIRTGQRAVALALIDLGATVRPLSDRETDDPLFEAAKYNLVEVVDRLIARGANCRARYGSGGILFAAARSNNPALLERLIALGCSPADRDAQGATPLLTAVSCGAPQSAAKLLALGVRDPLATKHLSDAIYRGQALSYSAAIPTRPPHYKPDLWQCAQVMRKHGQLPGYVQRGAPLLEFGPSRSRFLAELDDKSPAEIEAYIAEGGSLDAFVGTYSGQNQLAVQDAIRRSDIEQVRTMLALGVPLETPDELQRKRREYERYFVNPPSSLVSAAASVDEPTKFELLQLLIKHGAAVDQPAMPNYPAVLAAALTARASPDSVRLLLDHGALIDHAATKAYAELIQQEPAKLLRIEARLRPEEIARLRANPTTASVASPRR